MSFGNLTNQDFARYIIDNERSPSGVMHRKGYVGTMLQWLTSRLLLSKSKTIEIIRIAFAEIYFEVKMGHVDTGRVHLHNEAFNRAIKYGLAAKKEEVKARGEMLRQEDEWNNYMIGLA